MLLKKPSERPLQNAAGCLGDPLRLPQVSGFPVTKVKRADRRGKLRTALVNQPSGPLIDLTYPYISAFSALVHLQSVLMKRFMISVISLQAADAPLTLY